MGEKSFHRVGRLEKGLKMIHYLRPELGGGSHQLWQEQTDKVYGVGGGLV